MSEGKTWKDNLIAKLRLWSEKAGGGIFTRKTRKRLLGVKGLTGRDRTKSDFWYDIRERVKNAFIDLEIFIRFSGRDNVNQVITEETFEPVISALLSEDDEPDAERAEIAGLLIEKSFEYLSHGKGLTLSQVHTIEEAVDLSRYLTETFKPEGERSYYGHRYGRTAT